MKEIDDLLLVVGEAMRVELLADGRVLRLLLFVADILNVELPEAAYDVWHDRAVFHFLIDPSNRRRYVEQVRRCVRIGGHVLVATFDADGPLKCSGLDVARYSPDDLHAQFGSDFRLLSSVHENHVTPWGAVQKFVYCVCSVEDPSRVRRAA